MNCEKYVSKFIDHLKACDYSEQTIKGYRCWINHFISFCKEHYTRLKDITKVTKDIIHDYQDYLSCYKTKKGKHLASATQYNKLTAVKNLFVFLEDEDYILKNPAYNLRLPKIKKGLPRNILTIEEVMLILKSIKLNTLLNIRNKAILETFYACGLRPFELCNLRIPDIDLKQQILTIIRGKGGKHRMVPIGQYCSEYIGLYLEKSRKYLLKGIHDDPGFLFLSNKGQKLNGTDLNKNIMHQVTRGLDIKKHVTCYTFRHCCGSHLVQNNVDIKFVADLLGHSSVRTTQVYTHLNIKDLQKMHSLCHPREVDNQVEF
jgi:integrase/recombinase XerD